MKSRSSRASRLAVLVSCVAAYSWCIAPVAAAPFSNLDFESAVIGTPVYSELPTSQALPGWTTHPVDAGMVGYDTIALDAAAVSIQDGLTPYSGFPRIMYPLSGSYSVLLQSGHDPFGVPETSWISQTGDIPADANSILFLDDLAAPTVSLNGTVIPTSIYSVGPTVNSTHGPIDTYIGDIRAFSGQQNVVLTFESVDGSGTTLDDIQFSPTVVPEPSTLALIVIGVLSAPLYFLLRPRALAK
ncbi:MAG: hypothetical protein WAU84_05855 [Thermoguttaceae bacterium]